MSTYVVENERYIYVKCFDYLKTERTSLFTFTTASIVYIYNYWCNRNINERNLYFCINPIGSEKNIFARIKQVINLTSNRFLYTEKGKKPINERIVFFPINYSVILRSIPTTLPYRYNDEKIIYIEKNGISIRYITFVYLSYNEKYINYKINNIVDFKNISVNLRYTYNDGKIIFYTSLINYSFRKCYLSYNTYNFRYCLFQPYHLYSFKSISVSQPISNDYTERKISIKIILPTTSRYIFAKLINDSDRYVSFVIKLTSERNIKFMTNIVFYMYNTQMLQAHLNANERVIYYKAYVIKDERKIISYNFDKLLPIKKKLVSASNELLPLSKYDNYYIFKVITRFTPEYYFNIEKSNIEEKYKLLDTYEIIGYTTSEYFENVLNQHKNLKTIKGSIVTFPFGIGLSKENEKYEKVEYIGKFEIQIGGTTYNDRSVLFRYRTNSERNVFYYKQLISNRFVTYLVNVNNERYVLVKNNVVNDRIIKVTYTGKSEYWIKLSFTSFNEKTVFYYRTLFSDRYTMFKYNVKSERNVFYYRILIDDRYIIFKYRTNDERRVFYYRTLINNRTIKLLFTSYTERDIIYYKKLINERNVLFCYSLNNERNSTFNVTD